MWIRATSRRPAPGPYGADLFPVATLRPHLRSLQRSTLTPPARRLQPVSHKGNKRMAQIPRPVSSGSPCARDIGCGSVDTGSAARHVNGLRTATRLRVGGCRCQPTASESLPSANPRRRTFGLSTRLIALGVTPFIGGFVLSRFGRAASTLSLLPCPVRAVTGVPCPACGGTRTFTALAEGRSAWRKGNAPLVLYAAGLTLAGIALRAAPRRRRDKVEAGVAGLLEEMRRRPGLTVGMALLVALPPWIAALRMEGGRSGASDSHRAKGARC